ncbi:formate dehydrogenase subunit delta [Streptomyces sp. NPDC046805]|uniref:formate dehydrogenase subunit delta n=1 Tax=Streptomyces sp. NPDC046805 TaxID=3155134 RepID=UPI0034100361
MAHAVSPEHRMANDIAMNLRHLPSDEAAEAVAAHIRRFWDPRMRARLVDQVNRAGGDTLGDPLVTAAVALLKSPRA